MQAAHMMPRRLPKAHLIEGQPDTLPTWAAQLADVASTRLNVRISYRQMRNGYLVEFCDPTHCDMAHFGGLSDDWAEAIDEAYQKFLPHKEEYR